MDDSRTIADRGTFAVRILPRCERVMTVVPGIGYSVLEFRYMGNFMDEKHNGVWTRQTDAPECSSDPSPFLVGPLDFH